MKNFITLKILWTKFWSTENLDWPYHIVFRFTIFYFTLDIISGLIYSLFSCRKRGCGEVLSVWGDAS